MDVEEIKRTHSMRSVVESYGIKINRNGFCCCPFHKEKTPSMKIYKDSFHCFGGCGANGDIFKFVQMMDKCDFKTAFMSLGGTYEKPTKESRIALYRIEKAKIKREHEKQKKKELIVRNNTLIHASRELMRQSEPLSDDWWYYMDIYHMALLKDKMYEEGGASV